MTPEMAESHMETAVDSSDENESRKRKHDRKKMHSPSLWDRLLERTNGSVPEQSNETVTKYPGRVLQYGNRRS